VNKFFGFGITFVAGFLIQTVLASWLPNPLLCPHIVLLMTMAWGLMKGSIVGESFGLSWGLALDAMGMTAFGVQGFVLCWAGYLSGIVSRWMNAEETVSQMVFAFLGSLFYFLGLQFLDHFLGGIGRSMSWGLVLASCLMNVAVAPFVFAFMQRWIKLCG